MRGSAGSNRPPHHPVARARAHAICSGDLRRDPDAGDAVHRRSGRASSDGRSPGLAAAGCPSVARRRSAGAAIGMSRRACSGDCGQKLPRGSVAGLALFRGSPRSSAALFGSNQVERFADQRSELLVIRPCHLNAYPARRPDVRWPEVDLWCFLDEGFLDAGGHRQPHGDVAIVVMIVGKHREHTLRREKRRLAVGELFRRSRNRQAEAPKTPDLTAVVFLTGWAGNCAWRAWLWPYVAAEPRIAATIHFARAGAKRRDDLEAPPTT